ncbi:MAG: NADH-quinone oxidoreductase subunit M [Myxococcota bacterium]|nr:NADH-quinone oxidoreductase subunit M [Myxococcota bacterium]
MGPYIDGQVLSWVLFMPGATALMLLLSGAILRGLFGSSGLPGEIWRAIALGSTALTFLLAIWGVAVVFDPETIGVQLVEYGDWLPAIGLQYFLAVDGINLFLVLLTTLMGPLVLLAVWKQSEGSLRSLVFFLLVFESAALGVFLSFNLLLFQLFWQSALVSMYFIIGIWGGPRRVFAATKFLLYTGAGSMVMWIAILVLFQVNLEATGLPGLDLISPSGSGHPALLDLAIPVAPSGPEWWQSQTWLFLGFAIAFVLTLPLVPLHGWFPDAQAEAPTAGSALMAAVLLQMGAYGLLRFALPLFPDAAASWAWLFRGLALASMGYAVARALVQQDLKRIMAWLAPVGSAFVLLGLFSFEAVGLLGGTVGMLSRGLATAGLFLLVGMLEERTRTRQLDQFGGLAGPMPILSLCLGILLMSYVGVPGSLGFVFELFALAATFVVDAPMGIAACVGGFGAAACLYRLYRKVSMGPVAVEANRGLIDLDWRERAVMLLLIAPILWFGLYPNELLRRVEPSILETARQMSERRVAPIAIAVEDASPPGPADAPAPEEMP